MVRRGARFATQPPMTVQPFDRRRLLAGFLALVPGAASAQWGRPIQPLDGPEEEDPFWAPRSRRPAPRDDLYDRPDARRRVGRDPYGAETPDDPAYGQDPYGRRPLAPSQPSLAEAEGGFDPRRIYARVDGDPFPIPAFDYRRVPAQYLRREVAYAGREPAGTVVVDPRGRFLYFVEGGGRALRYGVGVGRQGFAWSGTATINSKQAWPDWYPPKEMIARDPKLARSLSTLQSGVGMHGGPRNPLGARAMYLWQNGKDTLYRIHGTVEPWTIGTSVSSGCIRMVNQDAMDLYGRVGIGASVVVLG
jgi:lipoprotein-anchoring transpeptidase ErfK/SrfK